MGDERRGAEARPPDRADAPIRSGEQGFSASGGGPTIAAMSTCHLPAAVRPLVEWTASYGSRRRPPARPVR